MHTTEIEYKSTISQQMTQNYKNKIVFQIIFFLSFIFSNLLPRSRVMAQIERVPTGDSFYASKRGNLLCNKHE